MSRNFGSCTCAKLKPISHTGTDSITVPHVQNCSNIIKFSAIFQYKNVQRTHRQHSAFFNSLLNQSETIIDPKMFKLFLLVSLIPALVSAAGLPVQRCKYLLSNPPSSNQGYSNFSHLKIAAGTNGHPPARQVRMANCARPPCEITAGQIARAQFDFRAVNGPHRVLRPVVTAILNRSRHLYRLPQNLQNACTQLQNSKCPLARNEDATFNFQMPINRSYPALRLGVEVSLVDENNRPVFCNVLDIQVRRPR